MSTESKPRRPLRTLVIVAAATLTAFVLLYTLAGFVLLPWYAKRELPRLVEEKIQRLAKTGEIKFNPFTLTLEISDFALTEKDGRPLVGFKHAVVNFDWHSVAQRAVVFGAIRLDAPVVNIEISPEGRLNLAALAGDQTAAPKETKPAGPPRVVISDLQIDGGTIAFDDQRVGYKDRFEELTLKLTSLSTFASDKGPYLLSAHTPGGATIKWKGEATISPLLATGTIALEHGALPELQPFVKEFLRAAITDGRASMELPYRFALPDGKPKLEINGGKLAIESFALTSTGASAPFLKFNTLNVDDFTVDLAKHSIAVGALRLDGSEIKIRRDEKGALDLADLVIPRKEPETPSAPWQVAVTTIQLSKGAFTTDDRGINLVYGFKDIALKLGDVNSDFSKPIVFDLSAAVLSGGTLSARGRTAADGTTDAKIEAAALSLTPLQPVLARYGNVTLASGELAFAGNIKAGQKNAALVYTGGVSISNFLIQDSTGVPLLGWKSLATTTLRAQIASMLGWKSLGSTTLRSQLVPTQFQIDALQWQEPVAKIAIAADKTINLRRALKQSDVEAAPAAPAADAAAPAAAEPATPAPATTAPAETAAAPAAAENGEDGGGTMQIRRITIKQGTLDFSDQSLAGGFSTSIHELNGTLNGISNDRSSRSQLALEGRVDEFGYAKVSGSLNPFVPRERSNVRLEFRNLDVTRVTPYMVRFAGYRIASGRLSLDLNYRVRNNLVEGDNQIVLDQFTLGEKIDTPGAMDLPLGLAIALLKDSDGKIDIALPVSGNLNDPKFDYGQIIRKAIVNLITGIITAPFRLIGRLFGGGSGEEAGNITFDPGSARLLPPEREKIGRIVQLLGKRPELKVQVPARYDSETDARALRRAALRRDLAKRSGLDIEEEDPPGPLSIDDKRTRTAVRELFAERFSSAELDKLKVEAEAKEKSRPVEADKAPAKIGVLDRISRFTSGEPQVADTSEFYRTLGSRLVAAQPLPAEALPDLAKKRAAAIGDALKTAGIDPARVTLTTAEPVKKPDSKTVSLELALAAK